MTLKILKSLFILSVLSLFIGCASKEKDANTPEALFKIAQEYDEAERYEIAIQKYTDVKNKFPYSAFATSSELAIADVNYKRESFAESQIAYQNFRDLHPKHPKIDQVIFKTGMSFYQQLPDSVDRDLTLANDAIYHFNEVIKNYPKSEFIIEAKEKRDKCYTMLAEKELYVADFYLLHENYDAALNRYEVMLNKYPSIGLDPKALLGASRAANKLNNEAKKKKYSELLNSKYANSDEAKLLKTEGL
jgi:outer membrane protein assembly factor BamD